MVGGLAVAVVLFGVTASAAAFDSVTGEAAEITNPAECQVVPGPPCLRDRIGVDAAGEADGRNATGSISLTFLDGSRGADRIQADVSCLAARGKVAVVGALGHHFGPLPLDNYPISAVVRVVDGGGAGSADDTWELLRTVSGDPGGPPPPAPTNCAGAFALPSGPFLPRGTNDDGDLQVLDERQTTSVDLASGGGSVVDPEIPLDSGFTFDFEAASTGHGTDATGTARVVFEAFHFSYWEGPVTCLAVNGDRAVIGFKVESQDPFPRPQRAGMLMSVVDGGDPGSGLDTFAATSTSEAGFGDIVPTDCNVTVTFPAAFPPRPLTRGDIFLVDAPAGPTSKSQCKNGGWRNYGNTFENQGQCVAFVVRQGCRVQRGTITYRDPYCANPVRTRAD
jgi:hypothetical protein